jgi:hypothetical protein
MVTYKCLKYFQNGRASTDDDDDDDLTDQSSTLSPAGKEKSRVFLCNWSHITYMPLSFFLYFV